MVKVKEQLSIENRLRKNDSYTKEPFCELCDCNKSVAKCKQKIENEANPCRLAKGRLYYNSNCKAIPEVQEFDIEIINERGETQFVKLDDKKSKGQLWFANALDKATKFIERDTTVIIDYLLSERSKGNVQFKEITARPLNAWRKDNKKSKAVELNLRVVNGAVSILSNESVSRFVGGRKTIGMEDNNINAKQVAKNGNELAEMIEESANLIKPKLYVNGSSAVNNKLTAPSPTETLLSLRRPYWGINDMPYDYLFKKVYGWICSLTDCILEPIAQIDEDGKPILEEYQYMGETKQRPKVTYNEKYVYKSVPTLSGLAIAIGVSLSSLNNYFKMSTEPNNRNKPIDKNSIDTNSIEFQIYNNIYNNTNDNIASVNNNTNTYNTTSYNTNNYNITTSNAYNNTNAYNITTSNNYNTNAYNYTSKDPKLEIIKRARAEIDNFHEKRLGLNENVSGSMMYLFNSKALEDGGTWSNNHSVTVEAGQSILGRVLSGEELDRLAESSTADKAEVIEIEFKEDEESGK